VKRTDLAKLKLLKINGKMSQAGTPARFGKEAGVAADRREQRKLDHDLVKQVQALAQKRQTGLNEVVAELLKKGLETRDGK